MGQLNDTEILRILAPENATWLNIKDPAQFTDGVAVRKWSLPAQAADEVAQWLRFHTDAKNVTVVTAGDPPVTTTTPVLTFKVTAPAARLSTGGLHALNGDWRGGEVGLDYGPQNPQEPGKNIVATLTQTLKEGWLTSLMLTTGETTTLNLGEVRIVNQRKRLWAAGKYDPQRPELAFFWPNIDGSKIKACADSVPTTLSSPVIMGETYAGTWYRKNSDTCREEDGTGVVWAVYSKEPDSITLPVAFTAAETATRTMTRVDDRAAANALLTAALVQVNGKSFTGSIQRTEEGYIAEIGADTAVALDSGWVETPDVFGTARRRRARNIPATGGSGVVSVASIKDSMNAPYTVVGGVVYPINCRFMAEPSAKYPGLFEVEASEEPGKSFLLVPESPWRNYDKNESYWQEMHQGGKHYKREVTHYVKNCGDEATAYAYLAGIAEGSVAIQGTHVEDHGYSRFTAHLLLVDNSDGDMGWVEYTI